MRKFYLLLTTVAFLFLQSVKAQDTANFSFTIGLNNTVSFVNLSHLHGDYYRRAYWSFGDGTRQETTPLANIYKHYATSGTYNVCLAIYKYSTNTHDSVLSSEVCEKLTLQSSVTPDSCKAYFSDTSFANANPLLIRFQAYPWHNHDKKPETICWNFGDNHDTCIHYNPSVANNYVSYHTYEHEGTYNVCVTITYQGGCQSTYCHEVRTRTIPDSCRADFNVEPTTSSTSLVRYFTALPWHNNQKRPVQICWKFGDGKDTCIQYSSATTNFTVRHEYANYGNYNVCVKIVYDGGCQSEKCKTAEVPFPIPYDTCRVSLLGAQASVNALEYHFYAGLMPNRSAERICWSFGDGTDTCIVSPTASTASAVSIAHIFPGPGTYHVCVKVEYVGRCVAYKCIEITIHSATNVCGGYMTDSLTSGRTYLFKGFSVMNSNDHVVSWHWTFGDGTTSNDKDVTHTFEHGGTFNVCLYIKTDIGCETRVCKDIVVPGSNEPQLKLSPNPVINVLQVWFRSTVQEQVTISIYNVNGLMLRTYTRNADVGANTWDFDETSLPAGIYSVVVRSSHQLATGIFFKL